MKRKTVTFLLVCMTMALFAGCGDASQKSVEGTETVESTEENQQLVGGNHDTGTTVASSEIEYNVDDFVTLGDYENVEITLNKADYEFDQEDVDQYIAQLIAYNKPYLPDESKDVVAKDDIVDVDYVGKKDGVAFDGGTATDQIIDVGKNASATTGGGFIDGFADGLVGMKVGETKDWEVTFPEDYQAEDLKGQTVIFTFTVNSICKAATKENIDDAYVKEFFNSDNVEDFFADAKSALEQQIEMDKSTDIRNAVMEAVTKKCTISSFPEGMLEARLNEYVDLFKKQYCSDGTDLETFLQSNYGMSETDFRDQGENYLKNALEQELVFEAIVKKENIKQDEATFKKYVNTLLTNGKFSSEDALYQNYGPTPEAGKKYLQKMCLQLEVCDTIAENAKINYAESETEEGAEAVIESTEK